VDVREASFARGAILAQAAHRVFRRVAPRSAGPGVHMIFPLCGSVPVWPRRRLSISVDCAVEGDDRLLSYVVSN
jgi:hypothetical protein